LINPKPNQRAGLYNFQKPGTGGYNKIKELPDIGVIASFGEICYFCVFGIKTNRSPVGISNETLWICP
jgi:hypothetical protein